MAHIVIMPKQGQSVESCIISEFKKKTGDKVAKGDILFSYETDKAAFEEEAQVEGTVLAVFFKDGDEVPVLSGVMVIGEPGESFETPSAPGASAAPGEGISPETCDYRRPQVSGETPPSEVGISPRARGVAERLGVNPAQVVGSGPGGRIIAADIQAAAASRAPLSGLAKTLMATGSYAAPSAGTGLAGTIKASDLMEWAPAAEAGYVDAPMSNMRKLIARSMSASLQNSAQLTHMLGADASRLKSLRAKAKKALEEGRTSANITINDLVCFAVIKALKKFPELNSHCLGDSMRLFKNVNLGIAVDTERGLMVPAVQGADALGIEALSKALKAVADSCKKGSVNPDLLSPAAASFTVSNLGGYGVEWFTPIINLPQSAILGVGTMVLRPVEKAGAVEFVPYIGLSLTYDHRAVDGGKATLFLKQVATEIENLEIEL